MKLENMSYEELTAKARELWTAARELKAQRVALSKEIAFRDQAATKLKALAALEGLSPDELARLKSLAQDVKPEGVESGEEMGKVG